MCLAIGCIHPKYLLDKLTSYEIAEWMAIFDERPFGQDYSDMVNAKGFAALWNQRRGRNSEAIKPEEFLPPKSQSIDEMKFTLRRHLNTHGNR